MQLYHVIPKTADISPGAYMDMEVPERGNYCIQANLSFIQHIYIKTFELICNPKITF